MHICFMSEIERDKILINDCLRCVFCLKSCTDETEWSEANNKIFSNDYVLMILNSGINGKFT